MAAAAIKQRSKKNQITTKASEIQTLLHQQIIGIVFILFV